MRQTINSFERGRRKPYTKTQAKLIAAFEEAGVEFKAGGWLRLKRKEPRPLSPVEALEG